MVSFCIVLIITLICILTTNKENSFICHSYFYISSEKSGLNAELKISLYKNKEHSYFLEIGTLSLKGRNFKIDRRANVKFISKGESGYYEVLRENYVKNYDDDLPDEISAQLTTKTNKTFVKLESPADNIIIMRDLKRIIMICSIK